MKKGMLFLIIIINLMLVGCGDIEGKEPDNNGVENFDNHSVEIQWEQFYGKVEGAIQEAYCNYSIEYPVITIENKTDSVNAINQFFEEYKEKNIGLATEYSVKAEEYYQEMPIEEQDFWYGFNLYRGMDERRVDSQVISMRESGWDYIGDNGYQSILHGFTFDTIEGKRLALTEIITDIDKFQQIVEETTQEEIVDISFLEDAWYLTDAGIRLIYHSNRLGNDELP